MNEDRILGHPPELMMDDALGTTVEFQTRDFFPPTTDMVGRGVFDLTPGQQTDDTPMALCITTSLTRTGAYDPRNQLARFVRWYRDGYLSSTSRYFDIGNQTRAALEEFEATGEPYHGSVGGMSAGSESLMRLAPVAIVFCDDPEAAGRFSADSSRTTHPTVECVEAYGAHGRPIAVAIEGVSRAELYILAVDLAEQVTSPGLVMILCGSCRAKEYDEISSSEYTLHSLEAALWALANTDDFPEGALPTVNLSGDIDTVGATYGQLVGVLYGRSEIPENWRNRLHDAEMVKNLAVRTADRAGTSGAVVGWGKSGFVRGVGLGHAHRQ